MHIKVSETKFLGLRYSVEFLFLFLPLPLAMENLINQLHPLGEFVEFFFFVHWEKIRKDNKIGY